jgi:hypothetical protein
MKTGQEIFDAVWQYFVVEGHPQAKDGNTCRYRGKESNCAIGCQLPDELYSGEMERNDVATVFDSFPKVRDYFGAENLRLMCHLQGIHDWGFEQLETRLRNLAARENLQIKS